MKYWMALALMCFWAAVSHAIWGFMPVTVFFGVLGALGGLVASSLFLASHEPYEPLDECSDYSEPRS